jgi:hypothetical protein
MICIQASSQGELCDIQFNPESGRLLIFIGDGCIGLDPKDAIVLRDKLADALTQASIQRDAKAAAGVVA